MDWSAVGGNPVPADAAAILRCARLLASTVVELQRWRAEATQLLGQASSVWKGPAGSGYADAGVLTVGQSAVWDGRLQAAAMALASFAGEIERLTDRAVELVLRAKSYQDELQSLQVAAWYDVKFGIGGPATAGSDGQSLKVRLSSVLGQLRQVRIDYLAVERRTVSVIERQIGLPGPVGEHGEPGERGEQGERGERGEHGEQGERG
ncbi:MAG: collagen-like protein [Actinomycetota bacterium]|nr:collagen-like protein [Actinomycetota bacterium]